MSNVLVDYKRAEPYEAEVKSGFIPSSITWTSLASLVNWLCGAGTCVIAGHVPDCGTGLSGTTTFRYNTRPRIHGIQRIWCFQFRAFELDDTSQSVTVRAPASTGTARTYPVSTQRALMPVLYPEELASTSSSVQELTFDVQVVGSGVLFIDSVRCFEVPRGSIELDATDDGVDFTTQRPGCRIYDAGNVSVVGVYDALVASDPRRVGLYHYVRHDTNPITTTSSSYADVTGLACPILVPLLDLGAKKQNCYWSAYAKVSAGTSTIKVTTSHSGVSDTVSITGTSYAWTTPRAISVDCEDYATEDGKQGTSWDGILFSYKSDGTNTLSLVAMSVWCAPDS